VLARRITRGLPDSNTFRRESLDLSPIRDGQVLIRTIFVSLEPHTIVELSAPPDGNGATNQKEIIPPAELGTTVPGYVLGVVVESRDPRIREGEPVQGYWGWQTYAIGRVAHDEDSESTAADENASLVSLVRPGVKPVSYTLHILGELGITGYIALTAIGQPKAGETVFVSSAAGNVGAVAGQTAKVLGCRVVGSVGSQEKASYIVNRLGFDAAINYKDPDLERQIDTACPDGIDVYHDNVGGHLTDLVLQRLRPRARVILCGATADWRSTSPVGPRLYWPLIASRARVEGFYVGDHHDRYEEAFRQVAAWVQDGRLSAREVIVDGFDSLPKAFRDFLDGRYVGKVLVRVAAEPTGWR
jgi:NADPH-dependent curcumin reductase CurA